MKLLSYSLAFFALVFAGCSKDADQAPAVLDGEYRAGATIIAAPIVMYTKNGVVNTPALVDRFLRRTAYAPSLFSRTNEPVLGGATLTLTIRGNRQATFVTTSPGRTDTVKTDITSQTAQYFVAIGRDSVATRSSSNPSDRCARLAGQMHSEATGKRCLDLAPSSGAPWQQLCRFRSFRFVNLNAGQLFVPHLTWLLQSLQSPQGSAICSSASSSTWNRFNSGVLNQLAAGDTLVVQERTIALLKQ